MQQDFNSYAQRIIYGHKLAFSDFVPISSKKSSESGQREFHSLLKNIIDTLYDDPATLKMPITDDLVKLDYSSTPNEITKIRLSLTKVMYEFYSFMYETGKYGVIDGKQMTVQLSVYKTAKISVKPIYLEFLSRFDVVGTKTKETLTLPCDNSELFHAWQLLSEVSSNLFRFACGMYNDDLSYLLRRAELQLGLNDGFLSECEEKLLKNGFTKRSRTNLGKTEMMFEFRYIKQSSGIIINNGSRSPFVNALSNSHQGYKAMLENFDDFDDDIRAYLVKIDRGCKVGCTECGKPEKAGWTIKVNFDNEDLSICPKWPNNKLDIRDIDFLIKFFTLQDEYASK